MIVNLFQDHFRIIAEKRSVIELMKIEFPVAQIGFDQDGIPLLIDREVPGNHPEKRQGLPGRNGAQSHPRPAEPGRGQHDAGEGLSVRRRVA